MNLSIEASNKILNTSYEQMVQDLAKPGDDIVIALSGDKAHLWHMATGVSGEAGELLDAIKKHVIYGKPLDRENVIEELGDLEFYLEGIRSALSIDRELVLKRNKEKLLGKRYASGTYSDSQAQGRADKQ